MKMETVMGIIQEKSESSGTKKDGSTWTRWAFKINDKTYSTFNMDIGSKFKSGDSVSMEGEQDGKYWNMKTMEMADQAVHTPTMGDVQAGDPQAVELLRQILAEIRGMHSYLDALKKN